ncbi:MAG: NAD-dependent dehydratase, partial [Proteobacteria bacterium]|nr:NAD-dependent dehydratase [Pseudomonadota bacterium]
GDTVKLISEITGKELKVKTEEARLRPKDSEVERLCCDHAKAKHLLGWQPKFAGRDGLKAGLAASVEWFARPENRAHYHDIHRYTV